MANQILAVDVLKLKGLSLGSIVGAVPSDAEAASGTERHYE
jgi:hypothetical protein